MCMSLKEFGSSKCVRQLLNVGLFVFPRHNSGVRPPCASASSSPSRLLLSTVGECLLNIPMAVSGFCYEMVATESVAAGSVSYRLIWGCRLSGLLRDTLCCV